jgi:hypothetical protein
VGFGSRDPGRFGSVDSPDASTMTPEEEAAVIDQMERVDAEKKAALKEPGPGWKDWFLFDAMRWWVGLLLLIVDAWIVAFWFSTNAPLFSIPSLIGAGYAEFVLWQYLYHRPAEHPSHSVGKFQRTWYRPVAFGRWTPEGAAARAGVAVPVDGTPDLREFL